MTRTRLPRTALTMLLATVLTGAALTAPASADNQVVGDPDRPAAGANLQRITVDHTATEVVIRARSEKIDYGDSIEVWIDHPGRPRNFYVAFYPDSDFGPIQRVQRFQTSGARGCVSWRARLSAGVGAVATARISRSCLGNPGRVRVSVRATYDRGGSRVVDWAPAARAWSPWVARG